MNEKVLLIIFSLALVNALLAFPVFIEANERSGIDKKGKKYLFLIVFLIPFSGPLMT